jgi:hypothetical protein
VEVAGTLEPGDNSDQYIYLKDKLTLQATAITSIDINKTTITWDKINVTSNIAYGGTLKINFTGTPHQATCLRSSILLQQLRAPSPSSILLHQARTVLEIQTATGELAVQMPILLRHQPTLR